MLSITGYVTKSKRGGISQLGYYYLHDSQRVHQGPAVAEASRTIYTTQFVKISTNGFKKQW